MSYTRKQLEAFGVKSRKAQRQINAAIRLRESLGDVNTLSKENRIIAIMKRIPQKWRHYAA